MYSRVQRRKWQMCSKYGRIFNLWLHYSMNSNERYYSVVFNRIMLFHRITSNTWPLSLFYRTWTSHSIEFDEWRNCPHSSERCRKCRYVCLFTRICYIVWTWVIAYGYWVYNENIRKQISSTEDINIYVRYFFFQYEWNKYRTVNGDYPFKTIRKLRAL